MPKGTLVIDSQSDMRKQLGEAIAKAVKPQFDDLRNEIGGVKAEVVGVKTELRSLQSEMVKRLDAIVAALNHNKL